MAVAAAFSRLFDPLRRYLDAPSDGYASNLDFLNTQRVVRSGLVIVVVFVLGFFAWAAFAPLDTALTAPGTIVVESHRKTIQHLEGGIVRTIFVHDGQMVRPGQLLIQLDETQARVNLALLEDEADALTAEQARLIAERDNKDRIDFPPDLMAKQNDPKIAQILRGEESTFAAQRAALTQQVAILTGRRNENARIIAGFQDEQDSIEKQVGLIQKEESGVSTLVKEGLQPLPRLLGLQRNEADLTGQRGQLIEKIAQTQLNTGETDLQIINQKNQFLNDVLKDMTDVRDKRYDLLNRIQAARDVLARCALVAPVGGTVVSLSAHTEGAVIRPGETVMEIVPKNDKLEVEAHVRPQDADDVYVGQPAKVSLGAYKQRRLPMITGQVTAMSADRLVDEKSGQTYFIASVSVDRAVLRQYPDVRVVPGMPVEVAIETGTQTPLDYFVDPIRAVLRRGMRER
ncbi:MAG TPA: HlyD family type I secretion periplasmic adaptor subunit [Rhizomicrobium sp.]